MCVLPWLSVLFYLFRDIYYEDVALWGNQPVLDSTVTQMTKLLNIPRCCLNIGATSKGLVAGSLNFLDGDGKLIDCQTPTGMRAFFFLNIFIYFNLCTSITVFTSFSQKKKKQTKKTGILIPNDVEKLSQFRSKAFHILVVEKDSTFQKLIDDKIERFIGDCILITVRNFYI